MAPLILAFYFGPIVRRAARLAGQLAAAIEAVRRPGASLAVAVRAM
jgi:hypothetical protein